MVGHKLSIVAFANITLQTNCVIMCAHEANCLTIRGTVICHVVNNGKVVLFLPTWMALTNAFMESVLKGLLISALNVSQRALVSATLRRTRKCALSDVDNALFYDAFMRLATTRIGLVMELSVTLLTGRRCSIFPISIRPLLAKGAGQGTTL